MESGLVSQVNDAGNAVYYDFDLNGDTVGITSNVGRYVNQYSYEPFGGVSKSTTVLPNPFTFVGEFGVIDSGNGSDFMGSRYYNDSTGQYFASNDPLGLDGGDVNIRRYTGNDPVNYVDPSGLSRSGVDRAIQGVDGLIQVVGGASTAIL